MVHLLGLSLVQQSLIASGALFQLGAYYIFTKECEHTRLVEEAQREREQAQAEAAEREKAAKELASRPVLSKVVKYRRQIEGVMEHVAEDVRPADMARTARVRFKHTLEAYQGETQCMPAVRREAIK